MRFSIPLAVLALVALGLPAQADSAPADKNGPPTKTLYVKDGDQFREATDKDYKAATGSADSHGSPTAHGSEEKGGLDFTGIKRYDLGIYTLIVFGLLLFILSKFAWPHISEGLKKREAAIIGARDEAAKAKGEAEELRVRLQKDYAEAQDKIRAMLDEARRDSDALRATEREAGTKDAQVERERARKEIQNEKDAALQELYQQAVQLASMMSAKTIRRQLSTDDHRRLLDESLAEIRGSVKA
jgi:F-type H+-transporting ATPase subunit b